MFYDENGYCCFHSSVRRPFDLHFFRRFCGRSISGPMNGYWICGMMICGHHRSCVERKIFFRPAATTFSLRLTTFVHRRCG